MAYEKMITRTCRWCNEPFQTTRSDAQFCKPTHRQAFFRWRKRLPATMTRALSEIDKLADFLIYEDAKPQAVKALVQVSNTIDETFRKFNIKKVR